MSLRKNRRDMLGPQRTRKVGNMKKFFIKGESSMGGLLKELLQGRSKANVARWKVLRMLEIRKLQEEGISDEEKTDLEIKKNFPYDIPGGVMCLYTEGLPVEIINMGRKRLGLAEVDQTTGKAIAFVVDESGRLTLPGGGADYFVEETIGGYLLSTESVAIAATREVEEEWGDLGKEIAQALREEIPKTAGHYLMGMESYPNGNWVCAGSFIRPYSLDRLVDSERLAESIRSKESSSEEGKVFFFDRESLKEIKNIFSIHEEYIFNHFDW